MVSSSKKVLPEKLPPTSRAIHFHSLRVHLQVGQWKSLDLQHLEPTAWGWTIKDDKMIPVTSDQPPAPDHLLKIVRCNCKMTSRNPCSSRTCSCRSNGLRCVPACGDCRGDSCHNSSELDVPDDLECSNRNVFDFLLTL